MADRLPSNAALHDKVIQVAVSRLDSINYDIYTNPGKNHSYSIGSNYPDIILTKSGEKTVQFIIEVETPDSLTISEAMNQWKKYASEIKASFYILVPFRQKNLAVNLCKQIGITVRFGTYETDFLGNVTQINYE